VAIMARAASLAHYPEVARQFGLNPAKVLRRHGLSLSRLLDPEFPIPVEVVNRLLDESASESGQANFGLLLAEAHHLTDIGVLSLLMAHQPTLRLALEAFVHYRHLLSETFAMTVDEAGSSVLLRVELLVDSPVEVRQAVELTLGMLSMLCRELLEESWKPQMVSLIYPAPEDTSTYRRVFGCKPVFDREFNAIVCRKSDLDRPIRTADPVMAQYARRVVEARPRARESAISLEVRRAVYLLLPTGRASIEKVAEGLGLNVRTMQRHLDQSGLTFSDVLDGVRNALVKRYISNPEISVTRISQLLGYSNPSSFTRWFIAGYGMAPQVWRRVMEADM
jgi:AraC-like DNA-binding protein